MNVGTLQPKLLMTVLLLGLGTWAFSQTQQPPTTPSTAPAQGAPDTQPTPEMPAGQSPANAQAPPGTPQGSAPLRVMVGKSLLINTTERLKRISVTDPNVADAFVVTPT